VSKVEHATGPILKASARGGQVTGHPE